MDFSSGFKKTKKVIYRDKKNGRRIIVGKSEKNIKSLGDSEEMELTEEMFTPDCGHSFFYIEDGLGVGQCSICNKTICLAFCFEQCARCGAGVCKSKKCSKVVNELRYCKRCFPLILSKKVSKSLLLFPFKVLLSSRKKI